MSTHQEKNVPAVYILPELHICPIGYDRLCPTLCQCIFQLFPLFESILPSGGSGHQYSLLELEYIDKHEIIYVHTNCQL